MELKFLEDTKEEATGHFIMLYPEMTLKKYKINCNKGLDTLEIHAENEKIAFIKAGFVFENKYGNLPNSMEIKK